MSTSDSELKLSDPLYDKWNRRFRLFNQIGLPLVLLFGVAYAFRAGCFWVAPIAETIAKKHVETLENMDKTQREIVTAQNSIAKSIETQSENGKEFVVIAKQQQEKLDQIHRAVVKPPKQSGD